MESLKRETVIELNEDLKSLYGLLKKFNYKNQNQILYCLKWCKIKKPVCKKTGF
jgi:hypothetical protein